MATTTQEQEILALKLKLKQPSDRLKQAINNCSLGFKKLADAIHEALELGKQEGFSPKEIGKMIREEMVRNGFTDRTVRKYLPAEAKMLSKVRHQVRDFAENNSTNSAAAARNSAKSDRGLGLTMQPQDYQSQDLPRYTKAFLIEIIHYLELVGKKKHKLTNSTYEIPTAPARPAYKHNKVSDDKTQEILALHNEGKTIRAIAALTGVPTSTVVRRIKSNP